MADPKTVLEQLIEEHGGVLVRSRKHKVYRFPNGATLVVSSTPECYRSHDNAIGQLKRILGIHPPDRGAPGTRRAKQQRSKQKQAVSNLPPALHQSDTPTWKEKLAYIEIVDRQVSLQKNLTKPSIKKAKPLTFEQLMLSAGVRKLK